MLRSLYLSAFCEGERLLYVDAEVANSVFDLCMAEQYLHGAQVTCLLIDYRCLGSAERMRPVVLPAQPDPGDPLINEAEHMPYADMIGMINSARKDEVVEHTSSAFEPCEDTPAGRVQGARTEPAGPSSAE